MFNSRQNENLDWDTIDRLAENPDFDQFIGDIKDDADIRKIKSQYDLVSVSYTHLTLPTN